MSGKVSVSGLGIVDGKNKVRRSYGDGRVVQMQICVN